MTDKHPIDQLFDSFFDEMTKAGKRYRIEEKIAKLTAIKLEIIEDCCGNCRNWLSEKCPRGNVFTALANASDPICLEYRPKITELSSIIMGIDNEIDDLRQKLLRLEE